MMNLDNIANQIADEIISRINPKWNTLQKIRFVYLEMGKYLEKNTDFFLNEKLDDIKKSNTEMYEIYIENKIDEVIRKDSKQYQIICKSAAIFLKTVYDKLGIVSEYVHTCGNEEDLLHWFLVVQDEKTQYFLTMAADLPYIKNGFPTEHFANRIEFFSVFTKKQQYVIPNNPLLRTIKKTVTRSDGETVEYEEIETTALSPTVQDSPAVAKKKINKMKELDESIGYGYLYENIDSTFSKDFSDMYLSYYESNMKIYDIFRKSFNIDKEAFNLIDDITKEQVETFKRELNYHIAEYFKEIFDIDPVKEVVPNYNTYFKIYLIKMLPGVNQELTVREILSKYKQEIKEIKIEKYQEVINILKTLSHLEDEFDKLISTKNDINELESLLNGVTVNKIISDEEANETIGKIVKELSLTYDTYDKIKKELSITKVTKKLDQISMNLLPMELKYLDEYDGFIPQMYLINKFTYLFPLIFDCDFQNKETSYRTNFSLQGYGEQVVIIKDFLKKIFSELSYKNCKDLEIYNDNLSPIDNRIRVLPYRNRDTGEYAIAFRFWANTALEEDELTFIYIPSQNILREFAPFEDNKKYLLVSSSIRNRIEEIENFDEIIENSR